MFKAELWAILQSIRWLKEQRITDNISIYTDSLSSLQALESSNSKEYLVHLIKQEFTNNIALHWIKAHAGHKGNEEADRLAKLACERSTVDLFEDPSRRTARKTLEREKLIEWQERWSDSFTKGRHTFELLPKVQTRKIMGNFFLNQFLTNHGCHGQHQARFFGGAQLCSTCQLVEDWEHILIQCTNFKHIREKFFHSKTTYEFIKQHWSNPKIKKGIEEIIRKLFSNKAPP